MSHTTKILKEFNQALLKRDEECLIYHLNGPLRLFLFSWQEAKVMRLAYENFDTQWFDKLLKCNVPIEKLFFPAWSHVTQKGHIPFTRYLLNVVKNYQINFDKDKHILDAIEKNIETLNNEYLFFLLNDEITQIGLPENLAIYLEKYMAKAYDKMNIKALELLVTSRYQEQFRQPEHHEAIFCMLLKSQIRLKTLAAIQTMGIQRTACASYKKTFEEIQNFLYLLIMQENYQCSENVKKSLAHFPEIAALFPVRDMKQQLEITLKNKNKVNTKIKL